MASGFDAEALDGLRAQLGHGAGFEGVWPMHRAAMDAFLAASTQWRTGLRVVDGQARLAWIALDYAAAKVAWDTCGLAVDAAAFAGLRVLETAAADALNGVGNA